MPGFGVVRKKKPGVLPGSAASRAKRLNRVVHMAPRFEEPRRTRHDQALHMTITSFQPYPALSGEASGEKGNVDHRAPRFGGHPWPNDDHMQH